MDLLRSLYGKEGENIRGKESLPFRIIIMILLVMHSAGVDIFSITLYILREIDVG